MLPVIFFGGGAQNKLERLQSQLDSFAIRQAKRERIVSPSGVPSLWRAVAKINGEKRVSCWDAEAACYLGHGITCTATEGGGLTP